MEKNETQKLLSECDAGIQMAVSAIDDVLPVVENAKMREQLAACRLAHRKLARQTESLLAQSGVPGKSPGTMAKTMSWLKTNVKLAIQPGDRTVADLLTEGTNMGIKSLHRYKNQYPNAEPEAKTIMEQLILEEKNLASDLEAYL